MHQDAAAPRPPSPFSGLLAAAILLTAATACAPESESDPDAAARHAAVSAALDSTYTVFRRAYAEANVQLLMDEVYAPEGYYLPPESPILQGQDQFRGQFSFLERFARDGGGGPQISFDIVDRDIDGDLAYDIGVYSILQPGASGDAEPGQGKFIVIWKRIDGDWRIWADGFSPLE